MRTNTTNAAILCVKTLALWAVTLTITFAAEPATLGKGAKYVALGSSFAAGPGIPVQQATCGRSDQNYPHLVAAALGLTLVDVSCSGATTAHVLDTPQGDAAPQINAITSDTALVTVTIGGNDISYSGSTINCGGKTVEDQCAAKLDQAAINKSVSLLPARLVTLLEAIQAKAPKAVIVFVAYPRVVPTAAQMCAELGLTAIDATYFAALGQKLEDSFVSATTKLHMRFADAYVRGEGHGPCADAASRWVNGAKPAGSGAPFHPTANGHIEMARLVRDALAGK